MGVSYSDPGPKNFSVRCFRSSTLRPGQRGQTRPEDLKTGLSRICRSKPTSTFRQGLQQHVRLVSIAALLARLPPVKRVGGLGAELRVWILSQDRLQLLQVVDPVQRLRCGVKSSAFKVKGFKNIRKI